MLVVEAVGIPVVHEFTGGDTFLLTLLLYHIGKEILDLGRSLYLFDIELGS